MKRLHPRLRKTLSLVWFAALSCALVASAARAQQRPAVVEGVDLMVPIAPAAVPIDGNTIIAYELHITNFLLVDISLSRLQVVRGDRPDVPASTVSRDAPVVLNPPLRGGPWIAIYDPLLVGGHRTAIYSVGGHARIPARFAVDWIRVPAGGAMEPEATRRTADWNGYGTDVLAVADATVTAAMDYVTLDLGQGRFAFYEHLKHGSLTVKVGDRVRSGQLIGALGYSGSSSIGPHLHFHVSNASSPLGAEGLPFVFADFQHLGAFASIDALMRGEKWTATPANQPATRQREHPAANAVVRFR